MPSDVAAKLVYSVSRLFAEAERPGDPIRPVLRLLLDTFDWDCASAWRVDYDAVLLRCTHFLCREEGIAPNFGTVTLARTFLIGEGLPGMVWKARQAQFITDLVHHPNFRRASVAEMDGIASGLAVPVMAGREVMGALELFSKKSREADAEMLDAVTLVGAQLGQFLERNRVHEELTGAEAQFRLVAEKTLEPIVTIDARGTILFANNALARLVGYSREELVGQPLTILIPPDLREAHLIGLRRYLATGEKRITWDGIVLPALHRDGKQIAVEVSFGEIRAGDRRVFSGYMRPVANSATP